MQRLQLVALHVRLEQRRRGNALRPDHIVQPTTIQQYDEGVAAVVMDQQMLPFIPQVGEASNARSGRRPRGKAAS